jgi:hypothetical protein
LGKEPAALSTVPTPFITFYAALSKPKHAKPINLLRSKPIFNLYN